MIFSVVKGKWNSQDADVQYGETIEKTINLAPEKGTGINDLEQEELVKVYPNPIVGSELNVGCSSDATLNSVEISDTNGRRIYSAKSLNRQS